MIAAKGGGDTPGKNVIETTTHARGGIGRTFITAPRVQNHPHAGQQYQVGVGWVPMGTKSKSGGGGGGRNVLRTQRQLRSMGYKISVDGILGPQTRAAIKAHRNGIGANKFNRRGIPSGGKLPPGTQSRFQKSLGRRAGGGGGGGGGGKGGGGGGGRGGRGGHGGGGGGGGLKPINANKYAKAETNLQFAGLINELQSQRDQTTSQNAQDLADLHSWYGHAADTAAQGQQSNDAASQHTADQQQSDLQQIMQSLGGSASGAAGTSLGNFGQALAAALAGSAQAQHGFDSTTQTNVARQLASALTSQQNLGDQALLDINNKMSQAKQDRGFALTKNQMDAQQLRLQQMAGIQNMQMLGQEQGLKLQGMALQNQNMALANQALGKQLANQIKRTGFKALTSGDRSKLSQGINATMYGNNMATKFNPKQAWERAANMLRSLGYDTKSNPQVRRYLSQVWMNYVSDWNHNNPTKQFKPAKNGTPFPTW